ncbi:hypothetical protein [Mycolicibacterium stellerae]|uniref:hypothetical protein n=1 Tax=Mycolicibacterium stellerae TaxID=2358193 RepID=UPI0013DE34C3|nr:hypothetical protein [Mycolicibacterium stellerae]
MRKIIGCLGAVFGVFVLGLSSVGIATADDDQPPPVNVQNNTTSPGCLSVIWQHYASNVNSFSVGIDGGDQIDVGMAGKYDPPRCWEPESTHSVTVCAHYATPEGDVVCTEPPVQLTTARGGPGVGEMAPSGPLPTPKIDPLPTSPDNFGVGWKGFHDYDFYFVDVLREGGTWNSIKHKSEGDWGWQRVEVSPGTTYTFRVQGCVSGLFGDPCSNWSPEVSVTIDPSLPYGPDTCKQGYVWRDAVPGDHICVTPERRDKVATDNALAASRAPAQAPAGRGPEVGTECNPLFKKVGDPLPEGCNELTGQKFCNDGFVGRDANMHDTVCVEPAERNTIAAENANPRANMVKP